MHHCSAAASAAKLRPIAGKATFMTEPSTNARLEARIVVASTSCGCATVASERVQRAAATSQKALSAVLTEILQYAKSSMVIRMHRSRLNGLLIDCKTDDIDAAARFWAEALGRPIDMRHPGSRGDYRM